MLRATITAKDPEEIVEIYEYLMKEDDHFKLIRIKNKINTFLRNVTLNFIYVQNLVVEIQIQCGEQPPNYGSSHFLYELARVSNPHEFY